MKIAPELLSAPSKPWLLLVWGFKKIYSGGFGRLLKSKSRKLDFHTKSERKCTQQRTLVPVLFAKGDA